LLSQPDTNRNIPINISCCHRPEHRDDVRRFVVASLDASPAGNAAAEFCNSLSLRESRPLRAGEGCGSWKRRVRSLKRQCSNSNFTLLSSLFDCPPRPLPRPTLPLRGRVKYWNSPQVNPLRRCLARARRSTRGR
jgi:hypothetical protein